MDHAKLPLFFSVPAGIFGPSWRLVESIVALVKKLFKRIIGQTLTFLAAPAHDQISMRSSE
ncbi:MAG TPA: hypothetical protein VGN93_04630 [Shinella sp.]|jgi:hypothetical protein|uniref:hypothetical protein n=1 Tax=Shinella sp. TaxID=1870904 RepID=UPI002E0DF5C3|nr:hypothetical protein [Shinella sp.]